MNQPINLRWQLESREWVVIFSHSKLGMYDYECSSKSGARLAQRLSICFVNYFRRGPEINPGNTPRGFSHAINLNNTQLWFFKKRHWNRQSAIFWKQTVAISALFWGHLQPGLVFFMLDHISVICLTYYYLLLISNVWHWHFLTRF